jgi:hypothetical protein
MVSLTGGNEFIFFCIFNLPCVKIHQSEQTFDAGKS